MKQRLFADDVHMKRWQKRQTFMESATEIDIHASTLHRIEHESGVPSVETFEKVCNWLVADPMKYLEVDSVAVPNLSGVGSWRPPVGVQADCPNCDWKGPENQHPAIAEEEQAQHILRDCKKKGVK